jgi:regulation of enolase protein 1 (concanavalin A-like superfamily)
MNLDKFTWLNPPTDFQIKDDALTIRTDPETDFWQRTYYGFRNDNAHAFLMPVPEKTFSFSIKVEWQPESLFDQCGIVFYQDAENWFKCAVEYDNPAFSRLGSVVTNLGYSDWATTNVESDINLIYYRLSRRGQDFLIENSYDGQQYLQMRVFHMHQPIAILKLGVLACSPTESSFTAKFSEFKLGDCEWKEHQS